MSDPTEVSTLAARLDTALDVLNTDLREQVDEGGHLATVFEQLEDAAEIVKRLPDLEASRHGNLSNGWENPKRAVALAAWADDDLQAELMVRRQFRGLGRAEVTPGKGDVDDA